MRRTCRIAETGGSLSQEVSRDHGGSDPAVPRISGFEFQASIRANEGKENPQKKQKGEAVMKSCGKELTLAELGNISDKALESWQYYGFDRSHGWRAVELGDCAVVVVDRSRNLNDSFVCGEISDFIEWLEECAEGRH